MWDNANVVVHFPPAGRPPQTAASMGEGVGSATVSHSPRRKATSTGDLLSVVSNAVGRDRASLREMAMRSWREQCRQRRTSEPSVAPKILDRNQPKQAENHQESNAEISDKKGIKSNQEKNEEIVELNNQEVEKPSDGEKHSELSNGKTKNQAEKQSEKSKNVMTSAGDQRGDTSNACDHRADASNGAGQGAETTNAADQPILSVSEDRVSDAPSSMGNALHDVNPSNQGGETANPVDRESGLMEEATVEAEQSQRCEEEGTTVKDNIQVKLEPSEEGIQVKLEQPWDSRAWCMEEDSELLTYLQTNGISEEAYEHLSISGTHLVGRNVQELRRRFEYLMGEYQRMFGNDNNEAPWNQWEDRIILEYCQTNGYSSDAFKIVSEKLDGQRTEANIKRRFKALMRLYLESNGMAYDSDAFEDSNTNS